MRLSTLASIGILAVSTAALAQVGQAPTEQKLGNDVAVAEKTLAAPPANEAAPANTMSTPSGNAADAAPPAGEPTGATDAPPKA